MGKSATILITMKTLIKEKSLLVSLLVVLALIFTAGAYQIDMQSHLIFGLIGIIPIAFLYFGGSNPKIKFGKEEAALVAFLVLFLASIVTRQHPYGFKELITFVVGAFIYFAASNLDLRQFRDERHILLWSIVGVGSAFSLFGIWELLSGPASRLDGLFFGAVNFSNYPNAMAQLLIAVLGLNWLLFKKHDFQESRYGYVVSIFLLLLNSIAFWLTFSRGAFLAMAVVIGAASAFALIREKKPVRLFKSLLTLLLILVFSFLLASYGNSTNNYPLDISDRASAVDASSKRSYNERYDFWKGGIEIANENPVLGVGPGGFEWFYPEYQNETLALSDHPHNLILKIASESGYPAAILFTLFLLFIGAKAVWELVWIRPKESHEFAMLASVGAGLVAHNMVDYNLNFTILMALFFGILGVLENAYAWKEKPGAEKEPGYLSNAWEARWLKVLTVMSLALFVVSALEGAGYMKIKEAEAKFVNSPLAASEILDDAEFTPFKHQYYELWGASMQPFEAPEYLTDFHPVIFYREAIKPDPDLTTLTEVAGIHGKNNFMYWHYLISRDEALREQFRGELEDMLTEYNWLLANNAHHTITTPNPQFAEMIYAQLEIEDERLTTFQQTWERELDKFNERYGTELTKKSFDDSIYRYF